MQQKHINQFTQEELKELMSLTKKTLATITYKVNEVSHEIATFNKTINRKQIVHLLLGIEVSIITVMKELCIFYDEDFDAKTNEETLENFTLIIEKFEELQKEYKS